MLYRLCRLVCLALFRVGWQPTIEGRENIPGDGPLIVASNHLSFIDSIVIPLAVPRKVVFLAKAEYWEGRSPATWPRRLFFAAFEAVPVQREQQQDAQASLDLARGVVERGDAFGIYPEGTRSREFTGAWRSGSASRSTRPTTPTCRRAGPGGRSPTR